MSSGRCRCGSRVQPRSSRRWLIFSMKQVRDRGTPGQRDGRESTGKKEKGGSVESTPAGKEKAQEPGKAATEGRQEGA